MLVPRRCRSLPSNAPKRELLDIGGTGMSVMEHSHRGKAYEAVHNEAIALVEELLGVPDNYDVLLLQGGASQQFAVVPLNLLPQGKSADYILTGAWSQKAYKEAKTARHRARRGDDREGQEVRCASRRRRSSSSTRTPRTSTSPATTPSSGRSGTSSRTPATSRWSRDMSSDIAWRRSTSRSSA